ncbi:MAG: hypothetical protein ACRDL6_06345 [Solirubrobacterales bacterium]
MAVALIALVVLSLVWFPATYLNADAVIALAWGGELSRGDIPDLTAPLMPVQHPLPTAVGVALSPLGPDGMIDGYRVLAVASLIALAYACFRLAGQFGGLVAGVLAVGLILTRPQIVEYAQIAVIDIPFTALVLLAAVAAIESPVGNRWKALTLLATAGLLRPEAWVLSGAYGAWLLLRARARPAPGIVALVLCGPALWAGFDLVLTGDPFSTAAKARGDYQSELAAAGYQPQGGDETTRFGWLPGHDLIEPLVPGLPDLLGWPLAIVAVTLGVFVLWARAGPRAGDDDTGSLLPVALIPLLVLAAVIFLKVVGFPYSSRFIILPAAALVALSAAAAVRLGRSQLGRLVLAAAAIAIAVALPRDLERIADAHSNGLIGAEELGEIEVLTRQPAVEAGSDCGALAAAGSINVINGVAVLAMQLHLDPGEVTIRRRPRPPPASVLVLGLTQRELDRLDRRPGPLLIEGPWAFAASCR